jgi:hypothetical protein
MESFHPLSGICVTNWHLDTYMYVCQFVTQNKELPIHKNNNKNTERSNNVCYYYTMINAENSLVIHLDSRFGNKIETNSEGRLLTTNYTYTMVEGIPVPDSKMCEISLYNATIPYSFYNVRNGVNNQIGITATTSVDNTAILFIPEGNYTAVSLKNELIKQQKASSSDVIKNLNLTISYDRTILKYSFSIPAVSGGLKTATNNLLSSITTSPTTITNDVHYDITTHTSGSGSGAIVTVAGNGTSVSNITVTTVGNGYVPGDTLTVKDSDIGATGDLIMTLTSGNIDNDLVSVSFEFAESGPMFGFTSETKTMVASGDNITLTSENCVDISDSIHGLYIRQNLSSKSTLDNETGTFSNILARIPINTNPGGIIFHTPSNSTHRALVSLQSIQTIGIKLTDDRNRTIDLNGLNFQVSIMITLVDKVSNAPELTRITRRKQEMFLANQMHKTASKKKHSRRNKKR